MEPAAHTLPRHAAVIPVYDENDSIAEVLSTLKTALQHSPEPVSVILVINEPLNAPLEAQQNNRDLLDSLRKSDGRYDGGLTTGSELFFIDLTNKDLPKKHRTVGNARKCGFDTFLSQSDGKVTGSEQLLFSLDADTLIAPDYFSRAFAAFAVNPQWGGAVFCFEHRTGDLPREQQLSVWRYEYYLLDYALKMHQCQSRYGFWCIGSAFVCRADSYMACGGMRRHAAGEDFYFLQALSKVAPLGVVPDTTVYPSGRISHRVPFGTGPAVARQLAGEVQKLYNAEIFAILKIFFAAVNSAGHAVLMQDITLLAPPFLQEFFAGLEMSCIWQKIVKNSPKNAEALRNSLHNYCDGFFILKFAHFLEEKYPQQFAKQPAPADCELPEALELLRVRARELYI